MPLPRNVTFDSALLTIATRKNEGLARNPAGVVGCEEYCRARDFVGLVSGEEQAEYIEIELFVEMLGRNRLERQELVGARIVYQNIQLSIRILGFGEETSYVLWLGDVSLDGNRFSAFLSNALNDGVGAGLAGCVVDDDCRAFRGKVFSDGCANTFGGSGDDGDFSC